MTFYEAALIELLTSVQEMLNCGHYYSEAFSSSNRQKARASLRRFGFLNGQGQSVKHKVHDDLEGKNKVKIKDKEGARSGYWVFHGLINRPKLKSQYNYNLVDHVTDTIQLEVRQG